MPGVILSDPLAGKDENARIQIARRIGRYLSVEDLPEAERKAAVDLARGLLGDAVERVRQALSESVKQSKFLPRDVALKIAHDVDAVSCPFLEVTEVFSENDWLQLVLTISRGARIAVARRTSMSEGLALALAETGDSKAADALVQNDAAPMTPPVCHTLIDRFEDSYWLLDGLAQRESLNAEIVLRLVEKVSAAARRKLEATYRLPNHTALLVAEAELMTILDLIQETPDLQSRTWALRLNERDRLTASFLLMAIRDDALAFFEAALSVLSGARPEQARTVVRYEGIESVARLLKGANIPSAMHEDFWMAIQEFRHRHQSIEPDASA